MNQKNFNAFMDLIMFELPPGPSVVLLSTSINLQKAGLPIWIAFLMWYFSNYSTDMWIYAAMHGTYGLAWYMKHLTMQDQAFNRHQTVTSVIISWALYLGPYQYIPYLVASGKADETMRANWVVNKKIIMTAEYRKYFALVMYILGVLTTMASDVQKNTHLKHVKKRPILIDDGMFSRTRSPNYLGEIMLYSAFAICTNHWHAYTIVAWAVLTFLPAKIAQKEMSLRRKPGWEQYAKRSNVLLPKIFGLSDMQIALIISLGFGAYVMV
jgi:hypothetical protein